VINDESGTVPEGYSRIDPWVISQDTGAEIAFPEQVFGAQERGSRFLNDDGTVAHAEVEIEGAVVMMFDRQPGWPSLPAHLRVYVTDAQETVDRALAAGARVVTRPTELPFGEVAARIRDPQGHLWWIFQRLEGVSPEEMGKRFAEPSYQERWPTYKAPSPRNWAATINVPARVCRPAGGPDRSRLAVGGSVQIVRAAFDPARERPPVRSLERQPRAVRILRVPHRDHRSHTRHLDTLPACVSTAAGLAPGRGNGDLNALTT
jgi:PhnB protein